MEGISSIRRMSVLHQTSMGLPPPQSLRRRNSERHKMREGNRNSMLPRKSISHLLKAQHSRSSSRSQKYVVNARGSTPGQRPVG
jgi:hypothetical protein